MPDDKPPHTPVPLPPALVREAVELADHIAHLAQVYGEIPLYWADPSQAPKGGIIRGPEGRSPAEAQAEAEALVLVMRRALAVLQGAAATSKEAQDEVERSDERGLLGLVVEAAELATLAPPTESERRAWYAGNQWVYSAEPPRTTKDAVDFLLRSKGGLFSAPTHAVLREPENRALLARSAGLWAGIEAWRGPRPPRVALWLVPLFDVAQKAELVGKSGDAKSWAENLRNRGLLPQKKAKK